MVWVNLNMETPPKYRMVAVYCAKADEYPLTVRADESDAAALQDDGRWLGLGPSGPGERGIVTHWWKPVA